MSQSQKDDAILRLGDEGFKMYVCAICFYIVFYDGIVYASFHSVGSWDWEDIVFSMQWNVKRNWFLIWMCRIEQHWLPRNWKHFHLTSFGFGQIFPFVLLLKLFFFSFFCCLNIKNSIALCFCYNFINIFIYILFVLICCIVDNNLFVILRSMTNIIIDWWERSV